MQPRAAALPFATLGLAVEQKQARDRVPYELEIRRATTRAFVDRLMWLAGGAPMPEVRAQASAALSRLQADGLPASGDEAANKLMAADIKRFLERPIEPIRMPTAFDAPPGAPIGDMPQDWLAPPSWIIR